MKNILIHEVGPRDGLQVEEATVPTEVKIEWIDHLLSSGVDMIQLGSFVHPKKVPQMADTEVLFRHYTQSGAQLGDVVLTALVLNEKGLERGLACGVDYFCMGVSASDTHSRRNTGMGSDEALERTIKMANSALEAGKKVQVSVQSAFGCGFEGVVPEARVLEMVRRFLDGGLRTISLADTAGHANPAQVERLFGAILAIDPDVECACHLHNTYGLGLANSYAALKAGVTCIEGAFGGLGGCPFTAVAGGNVCTEDLVHMMYGMGLRRDIRLEPLVETSRKASRFFGRELPGTIYKTGPVPSLASEKGVSRQAPGV